MVSNRCKMMVKDELKKLGLHFIIVDLGVVEIMEDISNEKTDTIMNRVVNLLEMNGMTKIKVMNMKISEISRRMSSIGISLQDIIEIHDDDRDIILKHFEKSLSSNMLFID